MEQWIYTIIVVENDPVSYTIERLNAMGSGGWELVNTDSTVFSGYTVFYFKQRLYGISQ